MKFWRTLAKAKVALKMKMKAFNMADIIFIYAQNIVGLFLFVLRHSNGMATNAYIWVNAIVYGHIKSQKMLKIRNRIYLSQKRF